MYKKLRKLCRSFPKTARPQSPLDSITSKIFDVSNTHQYVQSTIPPKAIHPGTKIEEKFLEYENVDLDDFNQYGPNEQYLINKVLYSPSPVLYLVGGIGVGKSSFSHFLLSEVFPRLKHDEAVDTSLCPCRIYLDFLDIEDSVFWGSDREEIQIKFSEWLCDRIEAELQNKFFDFDEEVSKVWQEILSERSGEYRQNRAFSKILAQMRTEDAGATYLAQDPQGTIQKRKEIRKKVTDDLNLRRYYLAALLRYIKERYYQGHPGWGCILILIDNIDHEPELVLKAINRILKPFAGISKIRTIINTRQTTFHQLLDDGLANPVDRMPYCGPMPLDIVKDRMRSFIAHPSTYTQAPGDIDLLVDGVKELMTHVLERDAFKKLFLSLCGRSIRKALMLARSLITNSVYDPQKIGQLGLKGSQVHISGVIRAILVGTGETFVWSSDGLIENIFEVQQHPGQSYLIKLRILRVIRRAGTVGLKLNGLMDILQDFNYPDPLIHEAINQMMLKTKRLIWSDAVKFFNEEDDLYTYGTTHLVTSSIGRGYEETLFQNLDYIQEVMLDTYVDEDDFGRDWDYGRLEHRFELVHLFCRLLLEADMMETEIFVQNRGPEAYIDIFGSGDLLTKEILKEVRDHVLSILDAVLRGRSGPSDLERFREEQEDDYDDRILTAEAFEGEMLLRYNPSARVVA